MALNADEEGCGCMVLYRWRGTRIATPGWWDLTAHHIPFLRDIDRQLVRASWFLCPKCAEAG